MVCQNKLNQTSQKTNLNMNFVTKQMYVILYTGNMFYMTFDYCTVFLTFCGELFCSLIRLSVFPRSVSDRLDLCWLEIIINIISSQLYIEQKHEGLISEQLEYFGKCIVFRLSIEKKGQATIDSFILSSNTSIFSTSPQTKMEQLYCTE